VHIMTVSLNVYVPWQCVEGAASFSACCLLKFLDRSAALDLKLRLSHGALVALVQDLRLSKVAGCNTRCLLGPISKFGFNTSMVTGTLVGPLNVTACHSDDLS
jgi:hypothetical protein